MLAGAAGGISLIGVAKSRLRRWRRCKTTQIATPTSTSTRASAPPATPAINGTLLGASVVTDTAGELGIDVDSCMDDVEGTTTVDAIDELEVDNDGTVAVVLSSDRTVVGVVVGGVGPGT